MIKTTCPSATLFTLRKLELEDTSHASLTDVHGMARCFMAVSIDCNPPCSAAEKRTCELFMQLAVWSEDLFPDRQQLREVSSVRSQLSFVSLLEDSAFKVIRKVLSCAHLLLKSHRCIVVVNLSYKIGKLEALCYTALKVSSSVKYMEISVYTSPCTCKKGMEMP